MPERAVRAVALSPTAGLTGVKGDSIPSARAPSGSERVTCVKMSVVREAASEGDVLWAKATTAETLEDEEQRRSEIESTCMEQKAACKADSSAAGTNLVRGGKSTIQLQGQAADLCLQLLLVSVLACQLRDLLELFLSVLQLLSALHVLVPALHHLTPQRCGLLVELQLTPLQPLDRLALLTLALVQCSSKLQYVLHQQL
ncbi:MAG: hypothetical protein FRX49_10110 [Trebouxia sp. A1-2]|nr:MAG: hypothetical protein FRX49_10110 [Trebouxia sp. A1-2]